MPEFWHAGESLTEIANNAHLAGPQNCPAVGQAGA